MLEIATGWYYTEDSFRKNVVRTVSGDQHKMVEVVPSFGHSYTWRVKYTGIEKPDKYSEMHHFSTLFAPEVDTTHIRFRVLQAATKYKDAFVFLDGNSALYDMNGAPVWFMPNKDQKVNTWMRDLKMTSFGSITFLGNDGPTEVNFDGDVLWQAPNNGAVNGQGAENYHHEFTRLSNGHYMVLGNEHFQYNVTDSVRHIVRANLGQLDMDPDSRIFELGTIIEYDEHGNVVWSWKTSDYYRQSDLVHYKPANDVPFLGLHENAFFFDEKNKAVYLSFKNISRVVKIKYPEGTVLNTYGEIYKPGVPEKGNNLFCGQHGCKYSQIGCLFLFNNNGCNKGYPPKVKILEEPLNKTEQLKKIWEYECTVDEHYPKDAPSGGNVLELPDGSVFVCMGGAYSKVFIVNKEKQTLWSALPERWIEGENKWAPIVQYRASIVYDRRQLEQLVWDTTPGK